jgi:hypothetical protein
MREWYLKLPNAVRAAINTAWQAAVAATLMQLIGFVTQLQSWAGDTATHEFPSVNPLGKAVGGIAVGLVAGVLTAIYRGLFPGPVYPSTTTDVVPPAGDDRRNVDHGYSTLTIVLIVLAIIALGIWIVSRVSVDDKAIGLFLVR